MNTIAASEDSWNYECKSRCFLARLGGQTAAPNGITVYLKKIRPNLKQL